MILRDSEMMIDADGIRIRIRRQTIIAGAIVLGQRLESDYDGISLELLSLRVEQGYPKVLSLDLPVSPDALWRMEGYVRSYLPKLSATGWDLIKAAIEQMARD